MTFGSLLLTSGRVSRLLRALGNERRLVILCHLCEREHSVTELCRLVGLSQSALSQHLAKLRRDNLVKNRRSAQTVFYSIASPEVAPILKALSDVFPSTATAAARAEAAAISHRPCSAETAGERAVWRKSST